ncbi:surface-adhesin E family protein [Paraburkholderia sp. RCC_158]|uniref:surface-adhesin E family protein n=1 Tax=Paraburkholderia sp. RCC_158 TaxID=3239220 RepID=UPI003524FD2D
MVISGLLVSAPAMAAGPNWLKVGDIERNTVYVDANSVRQAGPQTVNFWMRTVLDPAKPMMAATVEHIAARCDHPATYVRDAFNTFDGAGRNTHSDTDHDVRSLTPGSSIDSVVTMACEAVHH